MSALPARRSPRLHRPDDAAPVPVRRRAEWRQRLIDAEGGWRLALRSGSTLYAILFSASVVVVSGMVFGCTFGEWLAIMACIGVSLTVEIAHLALQAFAHELAPGASGAFRRGLRLSAAASMTIHGGAAMVGLGILSRHVATLLK